MTFCAPVNVNERAVVFGLAVKFESGVDQRSIVKSLEVNNEQKTALADPCSVGFGNCSREGIRTVCYTSYLRSSGHRRSSTMTQPSM